MTKTISFDMTWQTAAQIIAAALESGTDTGREAARAELFRMASILDTMRAEQTDAAEPTPKAEGYTVAAYNHAGNCTAYYRTVTQTEWTAAAADADQLPRDEAERLAEDWNSYARSKGFWATYRAVRASA